MIEVFFVVALLLAVWNGYYSPGIRRGESLEIRAVRTLRDEPIDGIYKVDESGYVSLGPSYGSVSVKGLNTRQAQNAITAHLKKVLASPEVSVTRTWGDEFLQLQAINRSKLLQENERLKKELSECKERGQNYERE